jgi:hypothetical protein
MARKISWKALVNSVDRKRPKRQRVYNFTHPKYEQERQPGDEY